MALTLHFSAHHLQALEPCRADDSKLPLAAAQQVFDSHGIPAGNGAAELRANVMLDLVALRCGLLFCGSEQLPVQGQDTLLCMGVQLRAGGRGCSLPGLAAGPFSQIGGERPTVPSQISAQSSVGRRPTSKSAEICEGTVGPKGVIKENSSFSRFSQ